MGLGEGETAPRGGEGAQAVAGCLLDADGQCRREVVVLAPGGTLVSLSDMTVVDAEHPMIPFLRLYLRLLLWNALPNRRHAYFFDIWAGHSRRLDRFRAELREDLTALFGLLADGSITAPVDRTFPLSEAAAALRHAEAGGLSGRVIIVPDAAASRNDVTSEGSS